MMDSRLLKGATMTIQHHYCESTEPELVCFLRQEGIAADVDTKLTSFDLCENDDRWNRFRTVFPQFQPRDSYYVYTQEELNTATWLTMRSTNWYKLEPKATEITFERSCGYERRNGFGDVWTAYHHQKQVAPFSFAKPIKWGRTAFYGSCFNACHYLFCSEAAKNILLQNGLTGMSFNPVLHYRKNQPLEDIHQFNANTIIENDSIKFIGQARRWSCPVCGQEKYIVRQLTRPLVEEKALGEEDFYTTHPIQSVDELYNPEPYLILSQKAYQVMLCNGLTRNLEILPLMTYELSD